MRKVHEKSIILGIGIGMIITAIAGMIFSTGTQKELSKEEIINLAKGYGLIEQVEFLNGENDLSDKINPATKTDDAISSNSTMVADSTATDTSSSNSTVASATTAEITNTVNERSIVIEIKYGYKSQQVIDTLLEKGVIKSGEDFIAVLDSYKASTKIKVGTFKFKENDDLHYIVKTICKFK